MTVFLPGAVVGFVLGVVVAALLWATGRRPYLMVERTETRTRHVVEHITHDPAPARLPVYARAVPSRPREGRRAPVRVVPRAELTAPLVDDRRENGGSTWPS